MVAWGIEGVLSKKASTGIDGYQLINGTGVIISADIPDDGNLHTVLIPVLMNVTAAETGGIIAITFTDPAGNAGNIVTLISGNQATGIGGADHSQNASITVGPNSTVTVEQYSALTAGAATLYAEIWAG